MFRKNNDGAETKALLEALLNKMDRSPDMHTISEQKDTYTISQIASFFMALLTLIGSLIGVWVSLNNQITGQKVTYDLTIEQIHKDIDAQKDEIKSTQASVAVAKNEFAASTKEILQHIDQLDNSISELYNSRKK